MIKRECSPGCPGWDFFDRWSDGTNLEEIECCDSCSRFASDEAACGHVLMIFSRALFSPTMHSPLIRMMTGKGGTALEWEGLLG